MSTRRTTTARAVDAVLRITLAAQSIPTTIEQKRKKILARRVQEGFLFLKERGSLPRILTSNDVMKDFGINVEQAICLGFAIPKTAPKTEGEFIVKLWQKMVHEGHIPQNTKRSR
jgi:hypothetical protein